MKNQQDHQPLRAGGLFRGAALLAALSLSLVQLATAQNSMPGVGKGLNPPNADQITWMERNVQRVGAVQFNNLGIQRVNQHRRARGLAAMGLRAVAHGAEAMPQSTMTVAAAANTAASVGSVLPSSVDNSTLPSFPPIRSQGSIGSCACWASAYYMGTHMMGLVRGINSKNDSDNTTKLSPKWCYNMINGGGDNGSWFTDAFAILLKNGGATWADFPYNTNYLEWCTDPAVWRRAISNRFDTTGQVTGMDTSTGIDNLKALLNNGYVCVYATNISGWQFRTAGNDPSTSADDALAGKQVCFFVKSISSGHAMTVVGYNDNLWADLNRNGRVDAGEKGAFRIANSWGTSWGEAGFAWLSYDALKRVSAVNGADNTSREAAWWYNTAYYVTARASYTPSVLGQFTLSTAKRNQLNVQVGRSATTSTTPGTLWQSGALKNQGGAFGFLGTTTAVSGTFVFDLTDTTPAGGNRYYLYVADNLTGSPVTISDFRLTNASGTAIGSANSSTGIPGAADGSTARAYADIGSSPVPPPPPPPTPSDDHGNTAATATLVAVPSNTNGVIENNADEDWFKFVLTSSAQITAKTTSSLDTYGYLLNSAGTQIAYNDDTNGLNFQIVSTLNAGTYYIRMHTYNKASSGSYVLNLSSAPVAQPEIRITGRAIEIVSGDTTPSTTDGTSFGSAASNSAYIDRTFSVDNLGNGDLRLTGVPVVNITGTGASHFSVVSLPVSTITAARSSTFIVRFRPLAAGTFTATITIANNDSNENPYTFAVSGSGTAAPTDDHGNTSATATVVASLPASRLGVLNYAGDVDYFRFTLTSRTTVTLSTAGSTDVVGYLYNASGSQLAFNDDGAGYPNFRIVTTLAAGTYYVKVAGYSSSITGAYTLSLSR